MDGRITCAGARKPRRVSCGTDDKWFFIVDHEGKTAYEDMDPAVTGPSGRVLRQGIVLEFVHSTPFGREIDSADKSFRGTVNVEGEDCYVVHIPGGGRRHSDVTWYLAKKDFLPRRQVNTFMSPDGKAAAVDRKITKLTVNPKLDEDTFKLRLPTGYTKTSKFAPDFLTP